MKTSIGNNGNNLVDVLHYLDLMQDGQTAEQLEEIALPYMVNTKHLENDDFWADVFGRAEELGYKLRY